MGIQEGPETVLDERNFLWEKCLELYNAITQNGLLSSATFRQAVGIAGNLFAQKGVDLQHSTNWFEAIANFLEMVEKAKEQKVGPNVS
jgi:hypothetical protein